MYLFCCHVFKEVLIYSERVVMNTLPFLRNFLWCSHRFLKALRLSLEF